jgi:hypothetical protein
MTSHGGREAALVSRTGNSIRVAINGAEDIAEFREKNGVWISEDCDPATVDFALTKLAAKTAVCVDDCICPPELAARLVTMLYESEREPKGIRRR